MKRVHGRVGWNLNFLHEWKLFPYGWIQWFGIDTTCQCPVRWCKINRRASAPGLSTFKRQTVAKIIDDAIINVGDDDRRATSSLNLSNIVNNNNKNYIFFIDPGSGHVLNFAPSPDTVHAGRGHAPNAAVTSRQWDAQATRHGHLAAYRASRSDTTNSSGSWFRRLRFRLLLTSNQASQEYEKTFSFASFSSVFVCFFTVSVGLSGSHFSPSFFINHKSYHFRSPTKRWRRFSCTIHWWSCTNYSRHMDRVRGQCLWLERSRRTRHQIHPQCRKGSYVSFRFSAF